MTYGSVGRDDCQIRNALDEVFGVEDPFFAEGDIPSHLPHFHERVHQFEFLGLVASSIDCPPHIEYASLNACYAEKDNGIIFKVFYVLANLGK